MNLLLRGAAALTMMAALLPAAGAQESAPLATPRDGTGYTIGRDVGGSIAAVGPDMDLKAFSRAVENAFAGNKPLLEEAQVKAVATALMQRIGARSGKPMPGVAPGTEPPAVDRTQVGYVVGADVGRSLAPIQAQFDMPAFLLGVRSALDGTPPLVAEAEATSLREALKVRLQAEAAAAVGRNLAEGNAFLARNRTESGVVTTSSGLQYRVLRQGAGPRPMPTSRVRVQYQGTLLDGKVFDSSYERGQPAEFSLDKVIPGWTEGVSLMPVGGKYRFWVPSGLAYGTKGSPGSIPPNATLIFDVELLQVL